MSTKVETLENSMVKLTIEVAADKFEEGMNVAYKKNRGKIAIQGFRKGKAPRKLIEKIYGAEIFYEDAANYVIPEAYDKAVEEEGLDVVSRPEIDVDQIESGKPFIFTAKVAVKPEVTLGDYKGIEVEKVEVEVTDEEVTAEIDKALEQNARIIEVTDRAIEDGDDVNIDFEGFIDGEAFEGGKAEGHDLTIGSHSFIGDFEEQLVGKNVGDDVEVNVAFPEDYHQESLQSKPALFKVKVNAIKAKELPELDDEFAMDVSEFDTLDEYKADVKETIVKRKENEAKGAKQQKALETAVENATMEIPEAMIDLEADNMTQDFAYRLQSQGLQLEQYFQMTGQNIAMMKDQMKGEAEKKIKSGLVLEAIAAAEALDVTEEEVEQNLADMAAMYGMDVEKIKETVGEEEKKSIKQDLVNQKALDLIVDATVEK